MANAVAEIVWTIGLFEQVGLGLKLQLSVTLYCEGKAVRQIEENQIYHEGPNI